MNVVFFARHLYKIDDLPDSDDVLSNFPPEWENHVQEMDENYVYIDYYRIISIDGAPSIRADRAESILSKCRETIINWKENSALYYKNGDKAPLEFTISSAAEGNFLEAINMSLHIFEQHQKDRALDRTGQMVLVVTAGVGVFDIDMTPKKDKTESKRPLGTKQKDLKRDTENRVRDLGIGCDLLCLGEQPLHSVPLFRIRAGDENESFIQYDPPDFINLNYYRDSPITLDTDTANINYVPRIDFQKKVSHHFVFIFY